MLFPEVNALSYAFLGPLVGALARSGTGWLADRQGGARVTVWVFALMMAGTAGVLWFIGIKDQPGAFWGFFVSFLVLFFATGVGNASTFQMIPAISAREMMRLMPDADPETRRRQAEKESAAITGFTSAIAAFGAFFIPKGFRNLHRADRRRRSGPVVVHGLLRHLPRDHLGRLRAPGRSSLRSRAPAAVRGRFCHPLIPRKARTMSHFLDRLTFFRKTVEPFSDNHGIVTNEDRSW